ncbi:MAG: hypothetical protein EAZ55_13525 [Cytophagales bacterium]|nr:MAG: hypothetical protein EAZ55_13525 [Cytophagales bacterium]
MKEEIISNLDNPRQLEKLYRDNKTTFKREFNLIYPDIQEKFIAQIWNERLNFEKEEISWGTGNELTFIIVASIIAGLIAKIPEFALIEGAYFYPRNLAFIVFPLLTAYFSWRQKMTTKKNVIISGVILISFFYINSLPNNSKSDTLILACIHLPLFLWAVLGYTFIGNSLKNYHKRLDFLRYNGDLVVMTILILITGAILTGITIGLFALIQLEIFEFYFKYIVVWGLAASPIVGTYLVQTNPQLVNRVSPVIAKVFTPLVLTTLVIYLIAVIRTGKDPYSDRDFLLIFNLLLIGVMAIILFSIAETSKHSGNKIGMILLLSLSIVTIIVNGIVLSAILFRISEWGITPNRLAVLGGNILILTNLLLVTYRLSKTTRNRNEIENVEKSIATFLPIYSIWTLIVTFVFPIIFNFK